LPHFNKKTCVGGRGNEQDQPFQTKNFASMLKQKHSVHMPGTRSPDSYVLSPGTYYG